MGNSVKTLIALVIAATISILVPESELLNRLHDVPSAFSCSPLSCG
jgi:hypothetical protein